MIRLQTEDDNGIFDCDFHDDIILTKNSEIALHSLLVERQNKQLLINGTNNTIAFQITNQRNLTALIPHKKITKSNVFDTLRDLTDAMNTELGMVNADNSRNVKEAGTQVKGRNQQN